MFAIEIFLIVCKLYIYMAISLLPFIIYHSFFESRYKPNSNYYHKKEWYHILKVFWAKTAIRKYKNIFYNSIKNESDNSIEEPRKLTSFMRSDSQIIYGDDNNGNSIYLRITLREQRLVETCIQIRINNGLIFQLPDHPLILISSIPNRQWIGGGLELKILEPFSLLEIKYNGFLRNCIRKCETDNTGEVIHCKFNFIWKAVSEAKFYPQDIPSSELAEAVAVEPWKDSKWIKLLGFHTGFDQYGIIEGQFLHSLENSNKYANISMNLTSNRKRIWGPGHARSMHRMLTLFGVDNQGGAFNVGVISYTRGCKELHIGSIKLANNESTYIENCDISLPDFFEDGVIPGAFSFSFKAKGQLYKCTAFTHSNSITHMRNEELIGYNSILVKTKYMINGEEATGYGVFWYKYKGKGIQLPSYIIRPGILTIETDKIISNFNSPECRAITLAGYKSTNISLIKAVKSNSFSTLEGFCILTNAMKKFIDKNIEIKNEILKLNDFCCKTSIGNIKDTCLKIQNLISSTNIPQYIEDMILQELSLLKFTSNISSTNQNDQIRWCWTVRNSLPINISSTNCVYMDCFTDSDVLKAIKKCWQQIYAYNEVLNRRKNGLPIILETGIVIQPTLDADISGIITTINAESGDPSILEVTGNFGLGIELFGNECDKALINRTWDNKLNILSTKIGQKTYQTIIGEKGLTKTINKNDKNFCLNKNQLIKLSQAAIEIEKSLGAPQKIKWAYYKDQLYIINTSKIEINTINHVNTTLSQTENQIIFNTTDNIFNTSTPCTILTKSITVKYLDENLGRIYDGKTSKRGGLRKILTRDGYIGCNLYQTILRDLNKNVDEEMKIHELLLTGYSFMNKEINENLIKRNKIMNFADKLINVYRNLVFCWNNDENTEESIILSQAIKLTLDSKLSAFESFKIIKRNLHLLNHILYLHTTITQSCIFYQKIYFNLLHDNPSDLKQEELLNFLSYYSTENIYNIPSTIDYLIHNLHKENLHEKFANTNPENAIEFLNDNSVKCYNIFANIMETICEIGLNNASFTSDIWENNTYTIIRIIQKILLAKKYENKHISVPKNHIFKSKFASWLDKCLKRSFYNRTKSLQALYHIINKFRISFNNLGKKLYFDGTIPDTKLIYHLSIQEIQQLVEKKVPHLVEKAINNSIKYENINNTFTSFQPVDKIMGHTVVQGIVTGKICILEKLSDVENIEIGDILITKCLDLAWSPYFGLISGLICEDGSPVSHGAISAYKYKVPCILVTNATKLFKTGDKVKIFGNKGVIEKII